MYAYFKHGREPLSSYTHFWGAAAGVLGILALLLRAHQAGAGGMALAGALVFGVSLVALYAASSLYHYALCGPKPLLRLRKLDHAMIYVLIAGSYTPFCLRYMNRQMLPLFLAAIWGAALAGILLGVKWGVFSQVLYVGLGLLGFPIFTMGGGLSYLVQPSFGFLLGLIPSAFVIGKLAKRPLTFWGTALAMLAGLAVLYAIGVPYMALIANAYLGKGLTFWQVIKNGMLIYLPGDLLKIALGSFLCVAITRRLPQVFAAA